MSDDTEGLRENRLQHASEVVKQFETMLGDAPFTRDDFRRCALPIVHTALKKTEDYWFGQGMLAAVLLIFAFVGFVALVRAAIR